MSKSDDKFADQAKSLFDTSVDSLDGATLSTLNQSRHRALEELNAGRSPLWRWAPAAGVTAAVLLAVMVSLPEQPAVNPLDTTAVADMEILLGEDSIEMLEDLEFYAFIDILEQENDVT
ncbi:MAG: hypothetical protein QNJ14_14050 [Woeseiaceae bacterium]|nr:hypothetical protein [Woeseiaceae bacterium]